jgi:hypothetical protein
MIQFNLERVTCVSLLAVSAVSLGLLLEKRFFPRLMPPGGNENALVGTRLDVPGLKWQVSRLNAVLFLSTNCRFCQESAPFYRRLIDTQQGRQPRLTLSVISLEPQEVTRRFLSNARIAVDGVFRLSSAGSGLNATPTLLFVNADGIVRRAFIGLLNESREREALEIVQTGTMGRLWPRNLIEAPNRCARVSSCEGLDSGGRGTFSSHDSCLQLVGHCGSTSQIESPMQHFDSRKRIKENRTNI